MSANGDLRQTSIVKLRAVFRDVADISRNPSVCRINGYRANLRTATQKSEYKYWFDVTPSLFEPPEAEFFIFVCGTPEVAYVFPRLNMQHLVRDASLGGDKQVPNFTVFTDSDLFEPAGRTDERQSIPGFRNAFFLIPSG